jgi:Lrp/AsnC family leucine-responsive transcriptional regulator
MDDVDLAIVGMLTSNARATFAEIAERVGLSGPSTADRVRRLEERGILLGYSARVSPEALGLGMTAFIAVTLADNDSRHPFLAGVATIPQVVECHHVAGDDDYLLKVHVDGTRGLEVVISEQLKALPGVARTRTTVVLSTAIERPVSPAAR